MFSVYVGVLHTNQSLEISCTRQNNAGLHTQITD
jgi:hypothetical protein